MSNASVVYWALNNYGVTIADIVTNLIIIIIAAWIILLNSIVLKVLKDYQNKEGTECYIISLSVSDLTTGVYLFYNTTYNLINFQITTECLLRFGLIIALIIFSAFQLVALSVDRCIRIVWPFRYHDICSKKNACVVIGVSCVWAMVTGLMPLLGWQNPIDSSSTCGFMKILPLGYLNLLLTILVIPILLIIIIYLRIYKEARRHAHAITTFQPGEKERGSASMNHSLKFTKTVVIVAGTYFLCWAPMGTVIAMHVGGYLDSYSHVERGNMVIYATGPAFINSLLNPIIYALKIPYIRRRFRRIFCRKEEEKDKQLTLVDTELNSMDKKVEVEEI